MKLVSRNVFVSLALVLPSVLGAQPSDTTTISNEPLFTSSDAIIASAFVVGTVALFPLDKELARTFQGHNAQSVRFAHHISTDLRLIGDPGSLIIGTGLYAAGKAFDNQRMADLGLHGTEAIVIAMTVGGVLKGLAGRQRPYVDVNAPHNFALARGFRGPDQYRSFPSGHTIMGFAAAAAVTSETHDWWPQSTWYVAPVMYGGATLIGLSRMYNNMHWASDVMLGAAIGTFAGVKTVRYHHSHPGNKLDKWLLGARISPAGNSRVLSLIVQPQ